MLICNRMVCVDLLASTRVGKYIYAKAGQVVCNSSVSLHYSRRMLCRVQLHSTKKDFRSAKPLPSAELGKELSAYPFTAKASLLSVAYRALDKGFSECHDSTRQRKAAVTARLRWRPLCRVARVDTRQRNVFFILFFKNALSSAWIWHSAKLVFFFLDFLCRELQVGTRQSSFFWIFFVECLEHGTRQSWEA